MKKQLVLLLGVFLANLALADSQKSAWYAKLTEETQCERTVRSTLGQTMNHLEAQFGLELKAGLVGRLKNQSTCLACSCPAGTYYIVQLKTPSAEQLVNLQEMDWEPVSEQDFAPSPGAVGEGTYRPLPIAPEK